ncbi:MAG TPA: winged helix DNA-binding domain-containing protein [Cytophagaceae bacterium]|nr:winged helix DNA-binding domain-containing protein [Cytophagaceae bacterium]
MTFTDIANIRLINQQITAAKFKTPKEVAGWMGAMQAQDYTMAKWAVGVRLPNSTEQLVETAIDKGEVIRTHLLRPTWHLVSADDIYWMLELTGPKILASLKSRHKELELSETVFAKSNKLIEKALAGGNHLTREELVSKLEKAKIATDNNRIAHLMLRAELDGLVCSGSTKNKKQTFALLEERVPKIRTLSRDEALVKLARNYFSSHGPATLQDFVWWSGLSVSDAKHALEMIKSDFISEQIGLQTYWFSNSFRIPKNYKESVYLLPAFDEFIISYKDRSASLHADHSKKTVSDNGIFRPTIVINGQVKGLWKRIVKKDKVMVEASLFQPDKIRKSLIEKAAVTFRHFLDKKVEITFKAK